MSRLLAFGFDLFLLSSLFGVVAYLIRSMIELFTGDALQPTTAGGIGWTTAYIVWFGLYLWVSFEIAGKRLGLVERIKAGGEVSEDTAETYAATTRRRIDLDAPGGGRLMAGVSAASWHATRAALLWGAARAWHKAMRDQDAAQKAGDMAAYNNLLATVTPARFKVCQMIGATGLLLGIALAMFRRVDADKRKNYKSMFISTALAVFLTGVTEPLEFMFMFCAMPLYIVYAILQGCAFAMAGIIHLRLHSFGNLEFITRIPMSLQAGLGGDIINFVICVIAFFAIGYVVAYFMIGKLNLATPGRLGNYTDDNADDSAADAKTEKKADKKADNGQAERIIALLGGRENIVLVDACMTRLRVTVKDPAKVADLAAWKAEGALSLLVKGDGIQAVYGPKADVLKSDINDIL